MPFMHNTKAVDDMRVICQRQVSGIYPPDEVKKRFDHLRGFLAVGPSTCKRAGNGARLTGDRVFIKDEIIGVYGGLITDKPEGDFVLEIKNGKMSKFVDADPRKSGGYSFFGMMNEDLNEGEYNAELGEDGFIRILKECKNVELLHVATQHVQQF